MTDPNKLIELAEKATPGEWRWAGGCLNWLESDNETVISASHDNDFASNVEISATNLEYIAAANPQAVSRLARAYLKLLERSNWASRVLDSKNFERDEIGSGLEQALTKAQAILEGRDE